MRQCRFSVRQIENYSQKISGSLLDLIDIHVEVALVDFSDLTSDTITGDPSAVIRERAAHASRIQVARHKSSRITSNAAIGAKHVRECRKLDAESRGYLNHAMEQRNFSTRAHERIFQVARTMADPAGKENITGNEIPEAIQFRSLDRRLFEQHETKHRQPRCRHFALKGITGPLGSGYGGRTLVIRHPHRRNQ